jgi:hypothetical protein
MAKEKLPYTSILDEILDSREPSWKDLDLDEAKKSGEETLDRTHSLIDRDFMDEISESASKHTPIPPSKSATLTDRLREKEKASPRVSAVQENWHKDAYSREDEYRNAYGDSDSLFNEVTMSLEQAASGGNLKENTADKKEVTDAAVQKYIRGLLNQGTSPAKVAQKLEKLAELELFNHTTATDYLQRNAGMLGMAYLEPNTFMDKQNPNYRHNAGALKHDTCALCHKPGDRCTCEQDELAWNKGVEEAKSMSFGGKLYCTECKKDVVPKVLQGNSLCPHCDRIIFSTKPYEVTGSSGSNECVASFEGMKRAGIKPQAKSVKQIGACPGCTFFKKDASGKRCNLYHLPVVANAGELSQIVNNLTPGVPLKQKRAALVQIANRTDEHVQPFDAGKTAQTQIVKTADASVYNQAARTQPVRRTFTSGHLAKLHDKGVSLKDAYKWADKKFGSIETSVAFRGFVQSLRKNDRGRIVIAASDLQFLNSIGIRNEKFEGSAKCASCPSHFGRPARPVEEDRGAMRVSGNFAQRTASVVAAQQKESAEAAITAADVRLMHQKGHSIERIFAVAAKKMGTPEAKRVVAQYLAKLKRVPGRIQVNASDQSFLARVGFKPEALRTLEQVRPPADRVVASSGDAPILAYPGMNDPSKKTASKKAEDGHSILNEYDLSGPAAQQDISADEPDRLDVESNASFKVDVD